MSDQESNQVSKQVKKKSRNVKRASTGDEKPEKEKHEGKGKKVIE